MKKTLTLLAVVTFPIWLIPMVVWLFGCFLYGFLHEAFWGGNENDRHTRR